MTTIAMVRGWEALDSRGNPTVACAVTLRSGAQGSALAPSGASTGRAEVRELRDGGERYGGQGVRGAVANVNDRVAKAVIGLDALDQQAVDRALVDLDGTDDLEEIGGNAVLVTSVATARAAAAATGLPLHRFLEGDESGRPPLLPLPMVNVISGGAHAGGAVDFQDFLVLAVGATCFAEAIEWAWRVRDATRRVASERGLATALVADEGGLGPPLVSNRAALELLASGIERSGLTPGEQVAIGIDVAASQLWDGAGAYRLAREGRTLTASELIDELVEWCAKHPIISLEDPLAEEDWDGWAEASARLRDSLQLLGDDLFATRLARMERAIETGVANAVLVKPNQCGTLTAARAVIERAKAAGYATVLSARSGDTEEDWLADLAVGWRTGQIKVGSTVRSERNAKWNRLLALESQLERTAFASRNLLAPGATTGRK